MLAGSEICMLVLGNTSILFKDIFALCSLKCHFNLAIQMLAWWKNTVMKLIVLQFS